MSEQGLGRTVRVRRRADFERAYGGGTRINGRFMTVFIVPNGSELSRFGVAATRKLGPAVIRNRAKRLAREVFRRYRLNSGLDVIVVPRREMLDAPFTSLEADYLAALDRRHAPARRVQKPRNSRASAPGRHKGI